MKLIIDIPDNEYRHIKEYYEKNDIVEATYSYIYHGIPLPKGHGKIIDYGYVVDAIDDWVNAEEYRYTNATDYLRKRVANTPTIIEADKAESDEQEKVDDYRDILDELEREEYYESKYGKEQE